MLCRMKFRSYLLLGILAFIVAVTGSDMVAKMAISDLSPGGSIRSAPRMGIANGIRHPSSLRTVRRSGADLR
jgi:hypothetical protein